MMTVDERGEERSEGIGISYEAVLAAERLTVRYGRRRLFHDVSFALPPGSVFALLGRNGSGKTSLVRCLLGHQKPSGGRGLVFGADVWPRRRKVMQRVGVLPEEPDAPPGMTARQISRFCARIYTRWDGPAVESRLERFEVPLETPFSRLSRGERGAVMLSLCLGHTPELLVLDDPTLGLDAVVRRALFEELIGDLADRGTTVFVTSHDLSGIESLADRVGMLHGGELQVNEPIDTLKHRFRRLRRPDAGGSWEPFEPLATRNHPWGQEAVVSNFDDDRLAVLLAARDERSVEVVGLTLEEIFLAVCDQKGRRA
jgi:ABC-2 type transport system ATP-binding protein